MVVSAPTAGTLVVKKGVTTDVTGGVVVSTSFGLSVELAGCPIWFRNQIAVRPAPGSAFSAPGDSGALIQDLAAPMFKYGLLFAGDDGGSYTYANPLTAVSAARGLRLPISEGEGQEPLASTRQDSVVPPLCPTARNGDAFSTESVKRTETVSTWNYSR